MQLSYRRLPLVIPMLLAFGCGPEPVPVPPPGTRTAPATPMAPPTTLSFAPDEPGISDIARVSRYVYREMNTRPECDLVGLPSGRYDYVYDVTVAKARITGARLNGVALVGAVGSQALAPAQWPPALAKRLDCLLPHLKRLELQPVPADGVYAARFVASGPPS